MTITAVPTTYADVRFRSRLEARVAVFFDGLGEEWRYEPERFNLALPRGTYLPDFWLPRIRAYLEVKGELDGSERRARQFATQLTGLSAYLLVGDLPRVGSLADGGWRNVEALTPAFEWDAWFPPGNAFVQAAIAGARAERFEQPRSMQQVLVA